jgi:phosphatidylserine/phosphatidylglycerophosphate/cardiolipin synthase-like enzyme
MQRNVHGVASRSGVGRPASYLGPSRRNTVQAAVSQQSAAPVLKPFHQQERRSRHHCSSVTRPSFRSNSSSAKPSPTISPHPSVKDLSDTLSGLQPCFGARGDEIKLLGSPQEFYALLLEMIKRAKRRIVISSLYIGAEEAELVSLMTAIAYSLARGTRLRRTELIQDRIPSRSTPSVRHSRTTRISASRSSWIITAQHGCPPHLPIRLRRLISCCP